MFIVQSHSLQNINHRLLISRRGRRGALCGHKFGELDTRAQHRLSIVGSESKRLRGQRKGEREAREPETDQSGR